MKKFILLAIILTSTYISAQCEFTAPYSENFDSVTAPELPDCWTGIYDTDWGEFIRTSTFDYSAPNSLEILAGGSQAPGKVIAITPYFTDLDNTKQIRFFAQRESNAAISLYIGTMSDPTDATTFTELTHITYDQLSYENWTEFTISFENYTGTDHYIAFKSGCESSTQSINIDDFVYENQPCYKSAPYSENFDSVTAPELPDCWTGIYDTDWGEAVRTSTFDYSAPNSLEILAGGQTTGEVMAITPYFTDLDNTKQIRFFAQRESNAAISLYIGTMSDPTDATTFTELTHITYDQLSYENWTEFTISFENYTGTDHYIAFKSGCESSTQSINIDNFVYEVNPSVGIKEYEFTQVNLYPNPTTAIVRVQTSEIVQQATIYSILGEKVKEIKPNTTEFELSVISLKNGVYFLQIENELNKSTIKFIKR